MNTRIVGAPIACFAVVGAFGVWASAVAQSPSSVPRSAFYAAIGGGYASANFGTQNLYAIGTSNAYNNTDGTLRATGTAEGPGSVSMPTQSTFAPSANFGYFRHFARTDWLWGARLSYTYLGVTSTVDRVRLPQEGEYTEYNNGQSTTTPFFGHAVAKSYETTIDHQLALTPFIGRSFEKALLYFGAGATYSRTRTNINNLVGFADITHPLEIISGPPQDFSGSGWVWGGALMVGGSYFFSPSWFLDVSYMYARTKNQTFNYSSAFTNPNGPDNTTQTGTLVGSSSGRVETNTVIVTIGKAF
jgi:opacity protein-like surface antigen